MHNTTIKKKDTLTGTVTNNRMDRKLVAGLRLGQSRVLNPDKRRRKQRTGGDFRTE